MKNNTKVACYYFPDYHVDVRNEKQHGKSWTEWELVKQSIPRFPGHEQPKKPLWGYQDEADPQVMAHKIDAAADHAIDVFIFDWYWYDDGPFLQRCLDEGFLQADNNSRLKFSLMWANHDWVDIHPAKFKLEPELLYPGKITSKTFDFMTDYIVENYFKHPAYWMINGCPYFSIYELFRLMESLGGLDATLMGLNRFREKAKAAGFPDIHLNAVNWGVKILPNEHQIENPTEVITRLGFASTTSYIWNHHIELSDFPQTPYKEVMDKSIAYWYKAQQKFDVPYHPNITVGWDSSPRTVPTAPFENIGYPYMPSMNGNTPELFEKALRAAKVFLQNFPEEEQICTINCWNEWTEGSYLEPDTVHGMAYLEAIKRVFYP